MSEKRKEESLDRKKLNNPTSLEPKIIIKFKDWIKSFKFIGHRKKQKKIVKYGDFIEKAMRKIEEKENLERFLKNGLGSYFQKIRGAWDQYKAGEIERSALITSAGITLGKKFVDLFVRESRDVLRLRKAGVYLALNGAFISLFTICIVYFLFLMPVDVTSKPKGNFILPGNEKVEWIFAMVMALIIVSSCGFLASFLLSHLTLRFYVKLVRKNQKLGLVPTENLFGSQLSRKLLFRAMIAGFLAFNLSYTLSSRKVL